MTMRYETTAGQFAAIEALLAFGLETDMELDRCMLTLRQACTSWASPPWSSNIPSTKLLSN